jgi:hypothetical protein
MKVGFAGLMTFACGAALVVAAANTTQAAAVSSTTNAVQPAAASSFVAVPIPQSIFTIPANPKEGRNPFFPKSTLNVPVAQEKQANQETPKQPDLSGLVLDGIIPFGTRRSVMINGVTFETGEEHDVKLSGGERMRVKCEQINGSSAIVLAANQRRELSLKSRP